VAISKYTQDNEKRKFKESTGTAGQPGVVVLNPDGSNIAGGTGTSAGQVQGTAADGATAVGNPVQVGGVDGSGNAQAILTDTGGRIVTIGSGTTGAAVPAGATFIGVQSGGGNLNGALAAVDGANTTGTGILSGALLAQFDDVSPTTPTENRFANLRMTVNRALMVDSVYAYGRATADTQIKGSAGFIHSITIAPTGSVTAGVLTVYDSLSETGTVIFSVALPITSFTPFNVVLDVTATTGIYVAFDATLANVQATVSYR
jgi:hypothetical protein